MANPSLQIGNGKFAIKENDLLGYSSSGTKFFPIPITMTRATLGSRVNPSGLIEDVELLGNELVDNGSFTTDSDWYKTGTWSIESNYATATANSTSQYIQQDFTITNGKTYLFTYEIIENTLNGNGASLSGSGGFVSVSLSSVIGTHQVYITADDSGAAYALKIGVSGTATTGTIKLDNVSVKEVTRDGLARVDYTDSTGSLLVEPQRTNLITYSEDLSVLSKVSVGTASAPVTTSNYATAPDGTQTATRVVFDLNGGTSSGDRSILRQAIPSGSNYYFSIYVKSTDGTEQNILWHDGGEYNLTTVTNEWVRITYDGRPNLVFSGIALRGGDGVDSSDILAWGFQVEEGSYPTSYIKTQGSTVTRNADQYTKTGISDKINSEEGVLFVEMAALSDNVESGRISVSNGTVNEYFSLDYRSTSNTLRLVYNVGGTNLIVSNIVTGFSNSDLNKIAYRYKSGQHSLYVNGISKFTSTETSTYAVNTLNQVDFRLPNNTSDFNGKVKQLQIFKTALSDSELATLTT